MECERCPRLREHCASVATLKRRAYRDQDYWGRPVPAFGDPHARVLILGLAPGAHGSNRTGRMFTGDASGVMLYRALHKTGFASQAESSSRDDGLILRDAFITAAARCAPPGNKPTPEELRNCRPYFERELDLLPDSSRRSRAGQNRVRHIPRRPEVTRGDQEPRRVRVRPRSRVSNRSRAALVDQFLSPQPAEHLDGEADREDADRRVQARGPAGQARLRKHFPHQLHRFAGALDSAFELRVFHRAENLAESRSGVISGRDQIRAGQQPRRF